MTEVSFIIFNLAAPWPTLGHYRVDSLTNSMLFTAFYLFWPDSHQKPLDEKFFVDVSLAGWLVFPVIPAFGSTTEHLRTEISEIIGETGHGDFLFYGLVIKGFPEK